VAEQQQQVEFEPVTAQDILADRKAQWDRFMQATTWAIAIVAAVLILLALFVG
jgi:hypothetical protein